MAVGFADGVVEIVDGNGDGWMKNMKVHAQKVTCLRGVGESRVVSAGKDGTAVVLKYDV